MEEKDRGLDLQSHFCWGSFTDRKSSPPPPRIDQGLAIQLFWIIQHSGQEAGLNYYPIISACPFLVRVILHINCGDFCRKFDQDWPKERTHQSILCRIFHFFHASLNIKSENPRVNCTKSKSNKYNKYNTYMYNKYRYNKYNKYI